MKTTKTRYYRELEQGTPERLAVRELKMTASHAQAIGANGKGLDTYIMEMMAKHYSSAEQVHHTNEHIERGNELEPLARSMYELETGQEVAEVGFVQSDEYVGCSPDGLVGDDGLIEIKCQSDKVHFQLLRDEKIPTKYIRQMQMQMLVTGRKWCDFVAYNPNYQQSLRIKRIEADAKAHEKLKAGLKKGKDLILSIQSKIGERQN